MSSSDDIEAIKQLKARYFRTMDTKDWEGMRDVFSPDVHIDTSIDGGGVIDGADTFIDFIRETLNDVTTVHHGHMPEIELTSDDHGHRPVGDGGSPLVARRLAHPASARLRPLPRDLREAAPGLAHRHPHPHPAAPGLRAGRRSGMSPA